MVVLVFWIAMLMIAFLVVQILKHVIFVKRSFLKTMGSALIVLGCFKTVSIALMQQHARNAIQTTM